MGYESVETDSLVTLKAVLENISKSIHYRNLRGNFGKSHKQIFKDAAYELDRINKELNNR